MKDIKARSPVTIMVVIAVVVLLVRIIIEQIIRINITQNESNASTTLRLVSAALESYAKDNQGIFPTTLSVLSRGSPPYLNKENIMRSPVRGYNYICPRLEFSGYSCSATPVKCRLTGKTVYTITTGGMLVAEECGKKESYEK